jgi:DNA-directed RNA polymerase specialized sigma24 family protein
VGAAGVEREWSAPRSVFQHFLKWLDGGADSRGEKYLETRHRLVLYFDRKNCACANELADETLTRIARRLAEEGEIRDVAPAQYCYIVAKYVLLEYQRRPAGKEVSIEGLSSGALRSASVLTEPDAALNEGERLDCLEACLQKLHAGDRQLILEYYRGEGRVKIENRRTLAERLGVTPNALSIRACRIRERLEQCVKTGCREMGR